MDVPTMRSKREIKDANDIRSKALAACDDPDAARAAWLKISEDPRCHGKVSRAARLAMLRALADGSSVRTAKKAAMAVLE